MVCCLLCLTVLLDEGSNMWMHFRGFMIFLCWRSANSAITLSISEMKTQLFWVWEMRFDLRTAYGSFDWNQMISALIACLCLALFEVVILLYDSQWRNELGYLLIWEEPSYFSLIRSLVWTNNNELVFFGNGCFWIPLDPLLFGVAFLSKSIKVGIILGGWLADENYALFPCILSISLS